MRYLFILCNNIKSKLDSFEKRIARLCCINEVNEELREKLIEDGSPRCKQIPPGNHEHQNPCCAMSYCVCYVFIIAILMVIAVNEHYC